ncbi:DMT family transporter [Desulfobacula sp.]|uniref:DMT family transporter n=1 Tax=Desulfobacula sp. TaxID=2593537 RepID=UPI00262152DC|nr:DMT family transporter [Desulfobacula sp.]
MSETAKKQSFLIGYLFAFGATAIWSGNFIIARGLHDNIPPVSLAFYRWLVAVIVFLPFALKSLIREWGIIQEHPTYFSITALLGVTTFNTLIYIAGHTTTAMNLSLIAITFPVFIVLLSRILYKDPITAQKGIGITLVLIGVVTLITKGSLSALLNISFNRGDVWMLLASIIFAVYSLFLRHKPAAISVMALQLSIFILGLLFLFPFFLWEQTTIQHAILTRTTIPAILYIGIFASLGAFVFWTKAVVILGPAKAGMVYYTLPLFSGFLAYVFLLESINILYFFSMLLIFMGIVTTNRG